jgi:hypothetical protein
MQSFPKPVARVAGYVVAALFAVELLYVLAANAIILSGVIQRAASTNPQATSLAWGSAWSPWPGRVYVSDLRLQVQDPVQEFGLTVDHAKVDVILWALLHRRFRASHVQAEGVAYRMLLKVKSAVGMEGRLAAFPALEGFARPALVPNPSPPPSSAADVAQLWSVELDQVDAAVTELWFLEYRYRGDARVHGGFALEPLRKLWVGPALLQLEGGKLTAGAKIVCSQLSARVALTIAPTDLPSATGLGIFHTLTSSIQFDAALDDLGVADLYVDGLRTLGAGRLAADIRISNGTLLQGSSLEALLPVTDVRLAGYHFTGAAQAKLTVSSDTTGAAVNATLNGTLDVPWFGKARAEAALSDVTAELALVDNDLTKGFHLRRLHAGVGEARMRDARAITQTAGAFLPIAAEIVLGNGPLVASATLDMTDHPLVRLEQMTLGSAELQGAAFSEAKGWTGATSGHFGALQLGFRLRNSKPESVPFPEPGWLANELAKVGIRAD